MANVLITGASGFIGSHIVEESLRLGHTVYAGVRQSSKLNNLPLDKIKVLTLDLSNQFSLTEQWDKLSNDGIQIDYVIHNAGVTISSNAEDFDRINFKYTRNLYWSFADLNYQPLKFILISSLAACGPGNAETLAPITTSDTANPITAYGRSKLKAEEFLKKQQLIPHVIIRPTAVYGPRDKDFLSLFQALNRGIEPYIGNQNQVLSFIHVYDLAAIICRILESNVKNTTYNVSDGQPVTLKEFTQTAKRAINKPAIPLIIPGWLLRLIVNMLEIKTKVTGKPSNLNKDKYKELTAMNWSCDSGELYKDINYMPQYNIYNGLPDVLNWYVLHKWL